MTLRCPFAFLFLQYRIAGHSLSVKVTQCRHDDRLRYLSLHNDIYIRDDQKNLGDTTVLAREMFSSGCRPRAEAPIEKDSQVSGKPEKPFTTKLQSTCFDKQVSEHLSTL